MADSKISALTAATTFALANEIPINEAGVSKKLTGTVLSGSFAYLTSALTGASVTYDFTSIAATWRELELRFYVRDTSGTVGPSAMAITLNADTGANYYTETLLVSAATATASESLATTSFAFNIVGGGSTANLHTSGSLGVSGYKGAGLKNLVCEAFSPYSTATTKQNRYVLGGWWNNVAAVTRVTLTPATGFDANSYCELWGIP